MNPTTTIEKAPESQIAIPADVSAGAMAAALAGDLSRLSESDKLKFVGALCQFTGLNPLSKPFDWLNLQGKVVLYANKGCAEQLRKIHGVNVEILERVFDKGLLTVRVKATDKAGRSDESLGVVPYADTMPAEARAIAQMKAETKAKRRVTLSIVGLGMLDESELDLVKGASPVSEVITEQSAAAKAEFINKLDAPKTEVVQEQPAKVEVLPPKPEPISPEKSGQAPLETVGSGASESASDSPVIQSEPEDLFGQPEKSAENPGGSQFSAADKRAMELKTVLSEFASRAPMLDCIEYCQLQGKLPDDTKDLAKLDEGYTGRILKKPENFIKAVEQWVKGGRK